MNNVFFDHSKSNNKKYFKKDMIILILKLIIDQANLAHNLIIVIPNVTITIYKITINVLLSFQ